MVVPVRLAWRNVRTVSQQTSRVMNAGLHTSVAGRAISKFMMPAMSPTMTEGGLATWKVKEGQSFSAGDVLLEIETDKATMDVEAQDDGVMAKIVIEAGAKAVPVGKTIAMLAEEGDDISNVEVPKDDDEGGQSQSASTSSSGPEPAKDEKSGSSEQKKEDAAPVRHHGHAPDLGRAQFPSVNRLLVENHLTAEDARKIKGTGLHGMITKGDVLAYLGKASSPTGSYKAPKAGIAALGGPPSGGAGVGGKATKSEPLTDTDIRALIFGGLAAGSHSARSKALASKTASTAAAASSAHSSTSSKAKSAFDELLDDYDFGSTAAKQKKGQSTGQKDAFKGLL